MRAKIGTIVAAATAAGAAVAASWAKRRKDADGEQNPDVATPAKATAVPEPASGGDSPAPVSQAPAATGHDDLTAIKGLGKVKAAKLVGTGVTSYAQIAAWTDDDIAEVGLQVNTSPGQIKREDWVGQAKVLAEA
jgi:predicted flap endonuclease-1-like 5' DNA nuclease